VVDKASVRSSGELPFDESALKIGDDRIEQLVPMAFSGRSQLGSCTPPQLRRVFPLLLALSSEEQNDAQGAAELQ
jgi:hypothetical protein